jgi:nucleoside-diphosphate-sugar epimerase
VVFHLASAPQRAVDAAESERLLTANVLFPTHLVEAMLATGSNRLVNTGTFWQHYATERYRPVDFYAATKQAFEDLLAYYHDAFALSCVTLKLYETYGPADPRPKLINLLIDAGLKGSPLDLSPGEQILDLTHVDDVAAAFVAAARHTLSSEISIFEAALVSGQRMSLKALVSLVGEQFGEGLQVSFGARTYRPREVMQPISASPSPALGHWAAGRRLREALPEMIAGRGQPDRSNAE